MQLLLLHDTQLFRFWLARRGAAAIVISQLKTQAHQS
jgi:hypothetical protein